MTKAPEQRWTLADEVNRFSEAWREASEQTYRSLLAANRATLAASGLSTRSQPAVDSLSFVEEDWETERVIREPGRVSVGDRVTFGKPITDRDLDRFALASGDTNRLHLDKMFAEESRFGGRIAHGTLVAGLISAALARFPGLTVYLSQDLTFLNPVEIGERLTAECEVVEDLGERRYRLMTTVTDPDGGTVIDGEAVVLIDELPDVSAET